MRMPLQKKLTWMAWITAMLLSHPSLSQAQTVSKTELEARPYFSAQVMAVGGVSAAGPQIALGGPVVVHGTSTFGRSNAMGFLIGKEFRKERDEDQQDVSESEDTRHSRLELEYWTGSVKQKGLQVGVVNIGLNDKLSAHALLINGLLRIGTTENTRWWVGGGMGWGSLSYPNRSAAIPGCQCVGGGAAHGATWRLKLLGERQLNEDTAVYLHLGHLKLPGLVTAGTPSTQYGKLGLTDLGVGIRQRF